MSDSHYRIAINSRDRMIVSIDDFSVAHNDITFLFGESGIGKSMISKAVYGLLDPDELHVHINNQPYTQHLRQRQTREIKKNSFFVFQEPSSHLNALMKITEQLTEGSLKYSENEEEILHHLWQTNDDAAIKKIIDIYPKPYRPSGGEKQRVLLAMAFKKINLFLKTGRNDEQTYFVFDEPTGSLDDNYRNLFLELLINKYVQRPFTIMIITHDYSIISEMYRKYQQILSHIHFKELRRTADASVALHDFSADEYLSWLQTSRPSAETRDDADHKVVPTVNSDFTIFNRSLRIYKDPEHTIPKDFVIQRGQMVYLKAPSGIGKTTLAKMVMGLYKAQKMSMTLCGKDFTAKTARKVWQKQIWGKRAGMVFQHADEALNLHANVKETFTGLPTKRKLTIDLLKLKLSELFENELSKSFLSKKIGFLSGGQKQRLNLLRTLIMDTDLVILDEPLNGLDFGSIKKVLSMLEEKRREGTALLMISHNEEIFDHLVSSRNIYYLA